MEPIFDHEKLEVYCLELQFVAWIADFFDDVSRCSVQCRRELFEQLDRASLSTLLNTAEGNGKRQGRQRAKFFDDARGSAIECAACLDASVAKRFVSNDRIRPDAGGRGSPPEFSRTRTSSTTRTMEGKRMPCSDIAVDYKMSDVRRSRLTFPLRAPFLLPYSALPGRPYRPVA